MSEWSWGCLAGFVVGALVGFVCYRLGYRDGLRKALVNILHTRDDP